MGNRTRHVLELVHRGEGHVHTWRPECPPCHWEGIPVRRRESAEDQYRDHKRAARKGNNGAGRDEDPAASMRRRGPRPRPLTPSGELPEELR